MSKTSPHYDVIVVGGGPAGMAAAVAAEEQCQSIALIESNPWVGGQLWRDHGPASLPRAAKRWVNRLRSSAVRVMTETTVIAQPAPGKLLIESATGSQTLSYDKLVLAPGAREQFVPFPGWTLSNVLGAGGLQLLAKSGWPVKGKRVVVAGSGPLLIAFGAQLRKRGAQVKLIAEQTSLAKFLGFGMHIPFLAPAKLLQAAEYQSQLLGVPYRTSCWPVRAHGEGQLEKVTMATGQRQWDIECDYLGCAFGLVPNLELPQLLGCQCEQGVVKVNDWQETSVEKVYCAGEPTGVGGVDRALVEGTIAGLCATGQNEQARSLFRSRRRTHQFTAAMLKGFALRPELRDLVTPDTIICRCEDVTAGQLNKLNNSREAKLYTRCGMGTCQGRQCHSVTEFLYGWDNDTVRPPVLPARIESMI